MSDKKHGMCVRGHYSACYVMAWVWACLLAFVLLPLHFFAPGVGGPAVHVVSFVLLLLSCVCCLRTRNDDWLLPFLLGLSSFLAIAAE